MKKLFAILLIFTFFQSCNDGDVIVTNFNFDTVNLKSCGSLGNYVFYKENSQNFESLSLKLGVTDSIYKTAGTKTYPLDATSSFVNYRRYDGTLGNNYFCNSIPPTSPEVLEDYKAASGSAIFIVSFEYNEDDATQITKSVEIILKDLVLIKGNEQIIIETLIMGSIENVS